VFSVGLLCGYVVAMVFWLVARWILTGLSLCDILVFYNNTFLYVVC